MGKCLHRQLSEYELKLFRCLFGVSSSCLSCACLLTQAECCYLLERMESYLFLLLLEVTSSLCFLQGEALKDALACLEVCSLIVARLFCRLSFYWLKVFFGLQSRIFRTGTFALFWPLFGFVLISFFVKSFVFIFFASLNSLEFEYTLILQGSSQLFSILFWNFQYSPIKLSLSSMRFSQKQGERLVIGYLLKER